MSQQKSKKTLINWDLVSVNPNNKNWNWKDLFCFWGVNIQSVVGFSLITSLYLIYEINMAIVFFGTLFGSILVFLSVFVTLSFGNGVAAVSFGVILGLKFPFKNGIFGAQPAATLNVKSKSKRLNNL